MEEGAWFAQARALLAKDLRAELRTKTAISSIGVFAFSALLLLGLATETLKDARAVKFAIAVGLRDPKTPTAIISAADISPAWSAAAKMGMLWILLCFAAFSGLSHSFTHEEEAGTTTALRLSMPAGSVYAGKLAFNLVVVVAVASVVTPLFILMTGMPTGPPFVFIMTMLGGCVGLAGCATITAALAAKAGGAGALYGAIGLPMLTVFLILLLNAANALFTVDAPTIRLVRDVGGLFSFGVLIIAVSALVFGVIWEE